MTIVLGVLLVMVVIGGVVAFLSKKDDTRISAADAFDTSVTSLDGTTTPDGAAWTVTGGAFEVQDGSARLLPSLADEGNAIATLDVGKPTAEVRAEISEAQAGAGVVFRYVDPDNYWALVAAPDFGTWNLSKRVDGKTTFVANTGPSYSKDSLTIIVSVQGSSVKLTVGKVTKTVADADLLAGTAAGLIGRNDDESSRWASISVLGPT